MSSVDSGESPKKKRRFFTERSDALPSSSNYSLHNVRDPREPTAPLNPTKSDNRKFTEPLLFRNNVTRDNAIVGFERGIFEDFVGEKVDLDVIESLQKECGENLELAVNMYLDGSTKFPLTTSRSITQSKEKREKSTPAPSLNSSMPEHRYIGAFGCEGWVTKSGTSLLKNGDLVRIERQKIRPPKPLAVKGKGKKGPPLLIPKLNTAASKRVDVLVRFTNAKGEEVGRISQNYADWISTLMDQNVCKFEGTCILVQEPIRSGATVYLQLRCSLLRTAFDGDGPGIPDTRNPDISDEKESVEEKQLRQKQIALVRLFKEINLLPSQTSETAEKHKRDGLLQAAEQYEKNKADVPPAPALSILASAAEEPEEGRELEEGKELEEHQIDELYKKAQCFDFCAPAAEPANSFALELRYYQKQALYWMISKEKGERDATRVAPIHPLWEEYTWPLKDVDDRYLPDIPRLEKFYVNPYSGELSLVFPIQEHQCLGGILADEMGLGKTIQMMSLIHSQKSPVAMGLKDSTSTISAVNCFPKMLANPKNVEYAPCTTLVVVPTSLIDQWHSESQIASKEGSLKSIVYYGTDKTNNLQALCCEANAVFAPNVIITSYGVVLSEYNQTVARNTDRGTHGGLFSLKFFRVILDEAHYIKNRQSKTARACYEIEAEHRWALTGTPIVNRLEDLFSLVRFLRVDPWCNFSFWRTFITLPFESKDFVRALDVVQTVLIPLVLRRTKDMKTDTGTALVPLPPKTVEIVKVELSRPEREVYDHILTQAKRTFEANVEAGTVLKAYTSIFAQILRLRQSCCHPVLIRNQRIVADEEEADAADAASGIADDMDLESLIERFTAETDDPAGRNVFGANVLRLIQKDTENECIICLDDPMIERTVTGCWHSACKECLLDYINKKKEKGETPRCISCRAVLNTRDLFEVVKDERKLDGESTKISLQRIGSNSSAKIDALIARLKSLRRELPGCKSVVFSQFTSFLALIEPALDRAFIPFLRLDGSMAQKSRASVLSEFARSEKNTVLLLSLRAGGVGLNLTMAKRVFMMDPWWSFAVEAQAIDRVHRMGQTDEVKVIRFIVDNSVEERMLKIQDRKRFIASSLGMMNVEDKKLQHLEDIKELLS